MMHSTNLLIIINVHTLCISTINDSLIMVALCNRADHYIFALLFLSIYLLLLSFFRRLISAAVRWMSTIL